MIKLSMGLLLGLAFVLPSVGAVRADELQIIAGHGITAPLNVIAAQFERASGHKVVIRYGTAPQLIKMAATEPFDLGITPQEVFKDPGAQAKLAPGSLPYVARVGFGVAVRAGAPKPDISTTEAFKQTLLKAKSVASIPATATGAQLSSLYERLGIAEEMKAKIKAQPAPARIPEAVASGEAEIAVFILNVLADPRLDIVGPLPAEIQRETVYVAGVAGNSKVSEAAKAFIAYMQSPEAIAVLKSKGMMPG